MAQQPPQTRITLPSINEMFPEHLMGIPPTGPNRYSPSSSPIDSGAYNAHGHNRHTPLHSPQTPSQASFQPMINAHEHDRVPNNIINDRARPRASSSYATPPTYAGAAPGASPPCLGSCCVPGPHPDPSSSSPHAPSPTQNAGTPAQVSASYSFDVLRPHPLTARLENVASSDDAAVPPRVPSASALACAPASPADSLLASITKARPAFRVQLNTYPSAAPVAVPPAQVLPPPAPATSGLRARAAEHSRYPPNYAANAYLSAPNAPGAVHAPQNLARQQQQQQPEREQSAGNEERRHRCPHCNKRFNRPSSLNIHVNTHTGAKPFVCRFPGCNRTFNVNSNMRRHYRNHLTTGRRRDNVAKLMRPPSPSPSMSASASPEDPYMHHLPSTASGSSSRTSRSPQPPPSSYHSDPEEERRAADAHEHGRAREREYEPEPTAVSYVLRPESSVRARARSRSSPTQRFHGEHARRPPRRMRERSASSSASSAGCTIPGCACTPISTALRPAFPESLPARAKREP